MYLQERCLDDVPRGGIVGIGDTLHIIYMSRHDI